MYCLSCKEAYGRERRPRVLQCGHSICSCCVLQLHCLNFGVIPCSQCGRENYCDDVSKLVVNLDLEARLTNLNLQDEEYEDDHEEVVAAWGTIAVGSGSPWYICSFHGGPQSSWCTTCHHAVCSKCRQFHERKDHTVVDHGQAKEFLLSRHKDQSQAFIEWLVQVEAVTRDTLEAAEAGLPLLRETLSLVRRQISRMRNHERALEGAASLGTIEELLDKTARWTKRSQAAAQQQVDAGVASLGRLESCVAELSRLQREVEGGFAQGAGGGGRAAASATTSLPHSEEEEDDDDDRRQQQQDDAAAPAPAPVTPVVLAQLGPFLLEAGIMTVIDLGGPETEGCLGTHNLRRSTTHIEFRAEGRNTLLDVEQRNDADRLVFMARWNFNLDRLEMWTWDPAGPPSSPPAEWFVSGRVFRRGAGHRVSIVEDEEQYEIFLDGVAKGLVEKAGGSRPPADTRIALRASWCNVHVSSFLVEAE